MATAPRTSRSGSSVVSPYLPTSPARLRPSPPPALMHSDSVQSPFTPLDMGSPFACAAEGDDWPDPASPSLRTTSRSTSPDPQAAKDDPAEVDQSSITERNEGELTNTGKRKSDKIKVVQLSPVGYPFPYVLSRPLTPASEIEPTAPKAENHDSGEGTSSGTSSLLVPDATSSGATTSTVPGVPSLIHSTSASTENSSPSSSIRPISSRSSFGIGRSSSGLDSEEPTSPPVYDLPPGSPLSITSSSSKTPSTHEEHTARTRYAGSTPGLVPPAPMLPVVTLSLGVEPRPTNFLRRQGSERVRQLLKERLGEMQGASEDGLSMSGF